MRRSSLRIGGRRLALSAVALAGLLLAACGPLLDPNGPQPGDLSGPLCSADSDCVPDGCCGRGTGAVHVDQAPVCTQACTTGCPVNQVSCGCGLPVCRNNHCTVAVTDAPGCPPLGSSRPVHETR